MNIEILEYTKYPLTRIGENASYCYNTELKDVDHAARIAKHCINSQHGRNLEFADVTLKITCSARCAREFYTHIGGAPTRVQASTRYITYKDFDYFTPEFKDVMVEEEYHDVMGVIRDFYQLMKEKGIENDITGYILPLAMETTFIWKGNIRTLENMFNQRLCYRALKEYRELMKLLKIKLSLLDGEWKWISNKLFVPKCVKQKVCYENNEKCPLWERYKPKE